MSKTEIAQMIVGVVGMLLPLVLLVGPSIANRRRLARIYPDGPFVAEKTFRSVGGQMGGSYLGGNGYRTVELGPAGLRISVWRVARTWFPTVLVPWDKITACVVKERFVGAPMVRLEFADWIYPTNLCGIGWKDESMAADILCCWQTARGLAGPPKRDAQSFPASRDQIPA